MRLTEVAIWWDDRLEHAAHPEMPNVKVLVHCDPENWQYRGLNNSVGACFAGWDTAEPRKAAAYIMSIFHTMVVRDGVPLDEAHRELMQIDEYRQWIEGGQGPFEEAHWMWASPETKPAEAVL